MPILAVLIVLVFSPISQAMCPQILGDYRSQIYDARVIQFADQNSISLLNIQDTGALELRAELQKLIEQVSPHSNPLVGVLESEQVRVTMQAQGGVPFIFVSMGLLKFAKDDQELKQILKYELSHPENHQQSNAEKYQKFLAGTVEVKPVLERAYDVKEVTGSADVVSLAKKITYTSEYMRARDDKFDRAMSVDLSNTRVVIQPLFTGGPLPTPNSAYVMHSQFENYYEIFKTLYPFDKTPAETLRYFEIRLQILIRTQMIQLVEEVLDARTKAQLPLTREEILILHHMLGQMWMLETESTAMMRLGHSSWLVSWTLEGGKIDQEISQLTEQRNDMKNTKLRDVIDAQILDLTNRKKILQIKVANVLVFYDLDEDTFMKLKQISTYPDKVPPHLPKWEPLFDQRIRGIGPLLLKAKELRDRIDSEFAYGGMLRDLRAKPEDAFWLLRAADQMSDTEKIAINKKAFDILLEMNAMEPLRTLVRSDHDAVMVKWFQQNQAEAQAYVIRVFEALVHDETFDANAYIIHRGSFIKDYISSNKYLEKYLTEHHKEKRSHEDYILTPRTRLALAELAWAHPNREFPKKIAVQAQILRDEKLSEKERNAKLFELVVYKNYLNEFYPAVFEHLELLQKAPAELVQQLVLRAESTAIVAYTEMFKVAGVENPYEVAQTFLFLTTRYFGVLTKHAAPSLKQIEHFMKQISVLPFMNGRYGFIKISNLIHLCKNRSKKEMLSIVDLVHPYLDNDSDALPEGVSAQRFFNEKYQIAQHLLKQEKPNFNAINRVMMDARVGSDEKAFPEHERIARPLQRTIMKAHFEFYWKKHQGLENRSRIQQALKDYIADSDLLIWSYGFKEGYVELAAAFTNDADRHFFLKQIVEILQATKESNSRNMQPVIESLQMVLKLNL